MQTDLLHSAIQRASSHICFADICIAVLGFFIFSFIHKKVTTKGPMAWPIIGMVPSFVLHFHELHEWNTRALIKSGGGTYYFDIMMGNCHGVVTSDPAKVEYMLKTRFSNFPKGKYYRERFRDLLGNGIFNADGDVWKEQRRIATSEMHTSRFLEYSAKIMQDLVHKKFLKLIEKKVFSGDHVIDLQEWLLRFTFDNVCVVAFGVDPGCLTLNLPEIPFAKAFEEATEYSLRRFLVPPFMWKSMKLFNLGTEKQLKGAIKVVHEFAETAVKNRKADIGKPESSKNNQDDLLSRLLMIQDDKNLQQGKKSHFSDKFLRDFCISFILAGRDTSSVALAWFFWLLYKFPLVENKILTEIDEIIAKKYNKPRELNDIVFQTAELEKMTYLQAALSEAMRLYPPVPIDFKEVQEDDVYPDGMRIRKGDQVFYHMFAMGRMESIWGKDCNEFKPERWIKDGEFMSENQFKYAVFNGGPRLCVGKKFAYVQMKMIAASILLRYTVKIAEGQVIAPKVTTTLYMKHGLLVTFQPRLNLF